LQRLSTLGIRYVVDPLFDEGDFLDGACNAFCAVHELLAANDMAVLAPLCSPQVHESFSQVHSDYLAQGLRLRSIVVDQLRSASIVRMTLLRGDLSRLQDIAEEAAMLGTGPQTIFGRDALPNVDNTTLGTLYLGVWVRFESTEICELERTADGALTTLTNTRGHVWQFSRAVPRALPATNGIETAWRLTGL
jgi:hypothetical protein